MVSISKGIKRVMDTLYDDVERICRGCHSFSNNTCTMMDLAVEYGEMTYLYKCPCPDCVIKVMCERACEKYDKVSIANDIKRGYYSDNL